jgi:hypothetical protein
MGCVDIYTPYSQCNKSKIKEDENTPNTTNTKSTQHKKKRKKMTEKSGIHPYLLQGQHQHRIRKSPQTHLEQGLAALSEGQLSLIYLP